MFSAFPLCSLCSGSSLVLLHDGDAIDAGEREREAPVGPAHHVAHDAAARRDLPGLEFRGLRVEAHERIGAHAGLAVPDDLAVGRHAVGLRFAPAGRGPFLHVAGRGIEAGGICGCRDAQDAAALRRGLRGGALGAEQLRPFIEELSMKSGFYVSAHPNAGLPNQFGEYDQSATFMASIARDFMKEGWVNIIGGCCGTTPDHIREFARRAAMMPARKPIQKDLDTHLSGLEPLTISKGVNFVNIGERTNVAGSKKFARLIKDEKYDEKKMEKSYRIWIMTNLNNKILEYMKRN